MKHLSIKKKLMGLMTILCLMAIGQFGFMAYQEMKAIHDGKDNLVKAVAEGYIDKIDRNLFERYGDVQAFSLSEPARSGNPARIKAFMSDMMGAYTPIYDAMIVTNAEGKVIAVNTVDKNGKELDSSWLLGKDYSAEEWFKAAIHDKIPAGTSLVEDLHADADVAKLVGTNGWVMNFTSPIRDKATNKVLGVWTNRMSWKDVVQGITNEELAKIKTPTLTSVFPFLTDADGRFLLHPDESKVLTASLDRFQELSVDAKKQTLVSRPKLNESYYKGLVHEAFTASKGYSIYPGRGWFARVQINESDPTISFSWYLIAFGIVCLIACCVFGWWIVNELTSDLGRIMTSLNSESTEVRTAAVQVTQGSQDLASAANQQAAALQETASSIEEMSAMIKKSADSATRSLQLSNDSQEAASRGKSAVESMIQAIRDINTSNDDIMKQVEESNAEITEIVKVITEIGNKTKVINDIVFQTKLLSFNASVEAARAGEHGKGFAVVAEEVGNLAQMSGNAAKEISDMLGSSIHKVEQIVEGTKAKVERLIQDGKSKVETGTKVANQCDQILDDVVKNVSEVNSMIGEITSAGHEQSQGVSEITKAMNQLDQVTHQNASTSQHSATAAAQLTQRADTLLSVVRKMKGLVEGLNSRQESLDQFVRSPEKFVRATSSGAITFKPLGDHRPVPKDSASDKKATAKLNS